MESHYFVLFVEDNIDFRDSAARFLEIKGFEVMVAGDGVEGLEKLNTAPRTPDAIVSDISMPKMNGYEFFQAVRQKERWKSIPFIFLTALDANADFRIGRTSGADEYLVKPFNPENFAIVLKQRIDRHREIIQIGENQVQATRNMIIKILAHELRTPLTYVTNGFDLLADEVRQRENGKDNIDSIQFSTILDIIHNGTNRLNRLAEQLVLLAELSSTESGKAWLHMRSQFDFGEVIHAAIENLDSFAASRDVVVTVKPLPEIWVDGVRNLLIHAIREPLRNAIQYSHTGGTVTIGCTTEDNYWVIEIADSGRGIKPNDLAIIWDLISQSERDKFEQQGFGLGLPITQKVLALHDGIALIESEFNQGTIVRLKLPKHES
ncbi:MAG: response regulator [Anaerolineales bacterium]|nr:response regulator [Anaerolineales bacterium]